MANFWMIYDVTPVLVEMSCDVLDLDARRQDLPSPSKREPIDQSHRAGVPRIDLQLFLHLGSNAARRRRRGSQPGATSRRRSLVGRSSSSPQNVARVLLDWYSSNRAMICRIVTGIGSFPISCV